MSEEKDEPTDGVVARLRGVRKRFASTEALKGIDLDVHAGGVVALLGPNGAGKTTAISLLSGLRTADEGTVELFGGDPRDPRTRQRLGVTPQDTGFPEQLKVSEIIALVRAHYPDPLPAEELLERLEIGHLADRQTGGLSGGERRRLAVALAFAGNPRLLILDEPTTGLDVDARRALWAVVRDFVAIDGTVLLTTHYLEEAEALADEVVVIDQGTVIARGSVDAIKEQVQVTRVRLRVVDELPDLPGVVEHERQRETTTLLTTDADELVRALVRSDVTFSKLEVTPVSLEDAFLVLTEREKVAT